MVYLKLSGRLSSNDNLYKKKYKKIKNYGFHVISDLSNKNKSHYGLSRTQW